MVRHVEERQALDEEELMVRPSSCQSEAVRREKSNGLCEETCALAGGRANGDGHAAGSPSLAERWR